MFVTPSTAPPEGVNELTAKFLHASRGLVADLASVISQLRAMLKGSVARLVLASTRSLAGTSIRPPVGGYGAWRLVADATALSRCTAAST